MASKKKTKDLSPKAASVKGGHRGSNLNDNMTLVRGANKTKDLAPKSSTRVNGGLIAANDNMTLVRGAKPAPKKRDLPSRKDVKGGKPGENLNDNMTLVRGAKPAPKKRDLPSHKDVKGGKKIT